MATNASDRPTKPNNFRYTKGNNSEGLPRSNRDSVPVRVRVFDNMTHKGKDGVMGVWCQVDFLQAQETVEGGFPAQVSPSFVNHLQKRENGTGAPIPVTDKDGNRRYSNRAYYNFDDFTYMTNVAKEKGGVDARTLDNGSRMIDVYAAAKFVTAKDKFGRSFPKLVMVDARPLDKTFLDERFFKEDGNLDIEAVATYQRERTIELNKQFENGELTFPTVEDKPVEKAGKSVDLEDEHENVADPFASIFDDLPKESKAEAEARAKGEVEAEVDPAKALENDLGVSEKEELEGMEEKSTDQPEF